MPDGQSYLVDPDTHPWRIRLAYAGEVRPLRDGIRRVLQAWATGVGYAGPFVELFEHEVRFETDAGPVWLPVQSQMLDALQAEAVRGAPVDLYVTMVGALDAEPVLTVNEFEAFVAEQ